MTTPDEGPLTMAGATVEKALQDLKEEILKYFESNPLDDAHRQVDQDKLRTQVVARIQRSSNVSAQATGAHAAAQERRLKSRKAASPHVGEHTQPLVQHAGAPQSGTAHVSAKAVDSIMRDEGASGIQGGRPEVYGFRKGNDNGYDEIMAARQQYGQGSEQEHAVVTRLLEAHARQAGALHFTDPGIQTAIMSVAHMRGVGGAHAILNAMATGAPPQYSARALDSSAAQALQQLAPEQFQDRLYETRLQYDQIHYASPTSAHYDPSWHRYERGLTNRYNEERQHFLAISHNR